MRFNVGDRVQLADHYFDTKLPAGVVGEVKAITKGRIGGTTIYHVKRLDAREGEECIANLLESELQPEKP